MGTGRKIIIVKHCGRSENEDEGNIKRVGTNTHVRMTTRTTRERENGDKPLGRGARMSI